MSARDRCAGCGKRIALARPVAERLGVAQGAHFVPWATGKAFHPGCAPPQPRTYRRPKPPSKARACTYKIRLSRSERYDWDTLLEVRGDADLAAMLRALVTAELARTKAAEEQSAAPTVAPERCRAVATSYGSLVVDPADARLPCACGTRERCYACGVPHVLVRLCRSCAARGVTLPRGKVGASGSV